jgi:GAF domain-containing protein
MTPNPKTAVGRVLMTKQVVQIVDLAADAAYLERDPARVAIVEVAGAQTLVAVPILKDDVLVGAISIYHQEIQAFSDRQIALLQNFAAQSCHRYRERTAAERTARIAGAADRGI